jgi:cysteinyl-tRNA synthetase
VIIDPFEDDIASSIAALKANGNQIGAYISIGTGETYRDDYDEMKEYLVTTPWGEWPDEFFVSSTAGVIDIMKARIDQVASWGFDWVEFDNMDWAQDDDLRLIYQFQVTYEESIAYYQELCDYAHEKGLKCMAKNTVEEADSFDGVLYESYNDDKNWWDASGAKGFLAANKLVIINHYNEGQCDQVYADYKVTYGSGLSFICEDTDLKMYVHYNQ